MTISQVAHELYKLSVAGYFNGEKYTESRLKNYIANNFRYGNLKLKNRFVMEIALPDGRWFFFITKYSDKTDGFDYTIPENREQETRILQELVS